MAGLTRFRWHHAQLSLAALLQFLLLLAPLSYAGNWSQNKSAFLHAAYISMEQFDPETREVTVETLWMYQRLELALLSILILGLGIALVLILLRKFGPEVRRRVLGKSLGGFALQVIVAWFVAQTADWHVGSSPNGETDLSLQPEFFLYLFPLILAYLAYQRMGRQQSPKRESEATA